MNYQRLFHPLSLVLPTLLYAASCSPRLYEPRIDVPNDYIHAPLSPQSASSADSLPPGDSLCWWHLLNDSELNHLIATALAYNRDLQSAASRVLQAQAQRAVTRAQFLPSVGLGVEAGANYTSETRIVQNYAIEPALTWELSLFGALRHASRAAQAQILASEWAYRGVQLSLTAEVATTYYTLLQYEGDLAIARRSYDLRRQSAALIDSMFHYGMSDGVALEQARSLVYSAAADIPQYRRAVEQTRLTLGTLLGLTPEAADTLCRNSRLQPDRLPEELPAGLPAELLTRRPDLMQAYYTMEAAAHEVGIARAARFPSISLTGRGGVISQTLQGLTSGDPWAWSALGSLTQPLFAFGNLRRKEQIARENYLQSAKSYEQSVIEALAEVEKTLTAVNTYRQQARRSTQLVEANQRIARMTQALYLSGLSDYLDVIDAERSLYTSQMEWINLAAERYMAWIALCKALGGGW